MDVHYKTRSFYLVTSLHIHLKGRMTCLANYHFNETIFSPLGGEEPIPFSDMNSGTSFQPPRIGMNINNISFNHVCIQINHNHNFTFLLLFQPIFKLEAINLLVANLVAKFALPLEYLIICSIRRSRFIRGSFTQIPFPLELEPPKFLC